MNTYDLETVEALKSNLDQINYKCKSVKNIKKKDNEPFLKPYKANNKIKNDITNILGSIEEYNENHLKQDAIHLGAISSGAHSLDFSKNYGFKIDESWNFTPILFVYECPGSNLDASFLGEEDGDLLENYLSIEKDIYSNYNKLLCNRIWHADYGKDYYENNKNDFGSDQFLLFEKQRKYSEFLLSLILEFNLGNLYTTNLFRYEIFRIEKNKKKQDVEKALNLSSIYDLEKSNNKDDEKLFKKAPNIFKEELTTFKPSLIISTESPVYYIEKEYELNNKLSGEKPPIVTVPHPAHFSLKNKKRYALNVFNILYGLLKTKKFDEKQIGKKMISALHEYSRVE